MEFNYLTKQLNQQILHDYKAFSSKENPVMQIPRRTSFAQITYVIQQYSIFPRELVCFADLARHKAQIAGWNGVAEELQDNIAEEMGSTTEGISHYRLLAEGLEAALGVPIKNTTPSIATIKLLTTMQSIFAQEVSYMLGGIYAIEATSIPELTLIVKLLEWLLEGAMPENLAFFFNKHLNEWELEHEAGLRIAMTAYIQTEQFGEFAAGFRAMLDAMEIWWQELAQEAIALPGVFSQAIA